MSPNNERNAAADRARFLVIALVVLFHGAIPFMEHAPPWWYVQDRHQSLAFTAFVLVADTFMMPLLFFLAGYFVPAQRGRAWVRGRLIRLGIPWMVGVALISPLVSYTARLSRGDAHGYGRFLWDDFLGDGFSQGHLWFLGVLLGLQLVAAALPGEWAGRIRRPALPLVLWGVGSALALSVAVAFVPVDGWVQVGLWEFQPARLGAYGLAFLGGMIAGRQGWLTPNRWLWRLGLVPATFLWLAVKTRCPSPTPGVEAVGYGLANALCGLAWGAALLGVAERFSVLRPQLTRTSFALYFVHHPIQLFGALVVVQLSLPLALKWLLLTGGALVLSWLAARLLLWLPGARRLFA